MADTQVLGTCVFGRAGSSPASRTQLLVFSLFICRRLMSRKYLLSTGKYSEKVELIMAKKSPAKIKNLLQRPNAMRLPNVN
jgi:hypothetical protein